MRQEGAWPTVTKQRGQRDPRLRRVVWDLIAFHFYRQYITWHNQRDF